MQAGWEDLRLQRLPPTPLPQTRPGLRAAIPGCCSVGGGGRADEGEGLPSALFSRKLRPSDGRPAATRPASRRRRLTSVRLME